MAKRKAGKKATVTFERTDGAKKRLPTRAEMTQWIEAASFVPFEGAVRFVGNEEGQELNRTYRHKDYATNVLTFDYCHKPTAQADIVIATGVIAKEAKEQIQYYRKGEISEEERNILKEIEVRIDQLDFDEAEILMKRWEGME